VNSRCHLFSSNFSSKSSGVLPHGRAAGAARAHAAHTTQTAAELPVVYHPLYSAPQLAAGHRFPMQVFSRIYERLLQQGVIKPSQVW
jgi:hypothetical protein